MASTYSAFVDDANLFLSSCHLIYVVPSTETVSVLTATKSNPGRPSRGSRFEASIVVAGTHSAFAAIEECRARDPRVIIVLRLWSPGQAWWHGTPLHFTKACGPLAIIGMGFGANNEPLTIIHKESTFGGRLLRDVVPNHTQGVYVNHVSYARPIAQYAEQLKYGLYAAGAAAVVFAPIAAPFMTAAYIGSWGVSAAVGSKVVTGGLALYTGTQGARIAQDGRSRHVESANQHGRANALHEREFMVLNSNGANAVPWFFREEYEVNLVAQNRIG